MVELDDHARRYRPVFLACAFLVLFFDLGILKSYGILVEDITRDLDTSTWLIGLSLGISHGLISVLAVFNPPLLRYFSRRQLIMTGSCVGSLGFIISAFSRTGLHFVIAMFITGTGYGFVGFSAMTVPADYFPDSFAATSSIVMGGGGIGMMTLPLITGLLEDIYGWRGAMVLMGAMSAHCIVCGALMRTSPRNSSAQNDQDLHVPTTSCRTPDHESLMSTSSRASSAQNDQELHVPTSSCRTAGLFDEEEEPLSESVAEEIGPLQLNKLRDQYNKRPPSSGVWDTVTRNLSNMWNNISLIFDLRLMIEHPRMIAITFSTFLSACAYNGWVIFLIPNALAKGFPISKAVFMTTLGGAGNMVGRFLIGFISSKQSIQDEVLFAVLCFIGAAAFFANYFAYSLYLLGILGVANGFSVGSKTVMINILPKCTVPEERLLTAISINTMSLGLGEPVIGALMGKTYDLTASYDVAFSVAGLVEIMSAFIVLVPWLCSKYSTLQPRSSVKPH